jgi:translation initiation factor 2B subunit (eIF-2B alpha/beta/delta family)
MLKFDLSDILSDRVSGASALYRRALRLFIDDPSYGAQSRRDRALRRLRETFPEMAVFAFLQKELKGAGTDSLAAILNRLHDEAEAEPIEIGRRLDRIWKRKRRVVTFSQSSLVMRLLLERRSRIDRLLISTAAPNNEGAIAAARYVSAGIDVCLSADAALPGLVRRGDYILVGADCVTERFFVNKCGTLPLLLTACAVGAVSLIVFERFKRAAARDYSFIPRQHPAAEILPGPKRGIDISNAYFETVPIAYADWLLSGDGAFRGRKR